MAKNKEKGGDIFGLAPYGEAINTLAKGAVQGASAFLSRICLPAAEEFGLLLRDRVGVWRGNNAVKIALKAEKTLLKYAQGENLHANPRLVMKVVQDGSWAEDDRIQEMWAGLLASACTEDGKDETNLIFMNILSQITSAQASVLNYACERSAKKVSGAGWIFPAYALTIELNDLIKITKVSDVHRLDRELDHLRSLGLIGGAHVGGFRIDSTLADITPTPFALQMHVRCQGYKGSPVEYYGVEDQQET